MKTAVSLPEPLFAEIDACARKLKLSRSGLIARAAREYLARQRDGRDATDAWNEAIEKGGQPGEEPAARAFRKRSRATIAQQAGRK